MSLISSTTASAHSIRKASADIVTPEKQMEHLYKIVDVAADYALMNVTRGYLLKWKQQHTSKPLLKESLRC
jgi:hypothetical protein